MAKTLNVINLDGITIEGWRRVELEKYCETFGALPEIFEHEGKKRHLEGSVFHESEFLQAAVSVLSMTMIDQPAAVEPVFFSAVTGIPQRVFRGLIDAQDDKAIRSIIDVTVGMLDFAKKALDYYGAAFFLAVDGKRESMYDLGDGYFYFNQA